MICAGPSMLLELNTNSVDSAIYFGEKTLASKTWCINVIAGLKLKCQHWPKETFWSADEADKQTQQILRSEVGIK